MKHKLFTLFLALATSVGTIFAQSGTCGDNLRWDLTDGVLTISGIGPMTDYNEASSPWFSYRFSMTSVIITEGATSIGMYAFSSCSSLTSVTIPNSVTSIGFGAFRKCNSLTSVTIPSSVTSLGRCAFEWCTSLTSVTIPSSIKSIGLETFAHCANLTNVSIPNSVISIESGAFYSCSSLTSVTIPNSVTSIGNSTFSGCSSLTSVTIPNSVTSIREATFEHCSSLTSVRIPNSVTSIESSAFRWCYSLSSVTIPSSVTSIGGYAFESCRNLTSVTIPSSVTSIEDNAFSYVPNIVYNGAASGAPWGARCINGYVDGYLVYSDEARTNIVACSGAATGDIIIPNSVTSIGEGAFEYCNSLTSVTIPSSVTSIGDYAFSDVPNIVYNGAASGAPWGARCINGYVDGYLVYSDEARTNIVACSGAATGNIIIPNSVTSIKGGAFSSCSSVTSVTIPNSVTSIGWGAFSSCRSLTYVTIPSSVTSIGSYAFQSCTRLTSIEIPSSVTNIKEGVFESCYSLTSVSIPNSVTSIGSYAFYGCISLTSVTIPSSVTNIGSYAFSGCINLTNITCKAVTPASCGNKVFYNVDTSIPLYVPAQSVTAYKTADVWKDFGNIQAIEGPEGPDVLSITEAIQIGMTLDSMATSSETYTIEGYVINAETFSQIYKNQIWYMADDENAASSDFEAYRCFAIEGEDTVAVQNGYKLQMTGKLRKYYKPSTASYVVEMSQTPATILSKPQIDTITVAQALAIGADLADGASTTKQYVIQGYVSSIKNPFNSQTGEQTFYIADDKTSTANSNVNGAFYIYRGKPETGTAIGVGTHVELTCAIKKYMSGSTPIIENSEFPIVVKVLQDTPDTCLIASGTCGANLTWTLSCDSVLTISGIGAMTDFLNTDLSPWYSTRAAIHVIVVEDGVTSIGRFAFSDCSSMTSVTIPNSVTSIGWSAFSSCSSMTSVTIPNSVTSIGNYAFSSCSSMSSVTIPSSVTSIGNYAFDHCFGLTDIDVETDNPNYCSVDGVLFNKNKTILVKYPGGKQGSYIIPNSVISIGISAFCDCSGLTGVTIPNSVTSIGSSAFWRCTGLTSVTIPNSVTSIGDRVFLYCSGLTSVTIPNSVTSIGSMAFSYCENLTSIKIPNSVTSIGSSAFWNCNGLTSITCEAIMPPTCENNVFDGVDKSIPLYVPAESVDAYKAAYVWKDFFNILPIEGTVEPTDSIYNVVYIDQAGLQLETEPITLHLPEAPVIEGFTFLKWQVVAGDLENGIYIQAVYTANEPTSAPAVYTNPANPAQKLIRNGNVYILTDDKTYTVTGQEVK